MKTLAGLLCVRNGFRLDYPWVESGRSLLGVCDELVISDCDSDDGTRQAIEAWALLEPRITICNFPWTNPVATSEWYPEWINYTRQHAKSEHVLHLDADELVHEKDYNLIRQSADNGKVLFLHRYNFWKDAYHLIPEGECCGTKVLRMAKSNMPIPSDYPYGPAQQTMEVAEESSIGCYHYGFLRHREAMERKAKVVQQIWAGDYDPRLKQAFAEPTPWMENECVAPWIKNLTPFEGSHPKLIENWLIERGHL